MLECAEEKEGKKPKRIIIQNLNIEKPTTTQNNNMTREEFVYNQIPKDHCTEDEKAAVKKIVDKYSRQFYIDGDPLTKTDVLKHRIYLKPNSKPVNQRQYRTEAALKEKLIQQAREYEDLGIISRCRSEYNSPALMVKKKDEFGNKTDLRFVVDFRGLNEQCMRGRNNGFFSWSKNFFSNRRP